MECYLKVDIFTMFFQTIELSMSRSGWSSLHSYNCLAIIFSSLLTMYPLPNSLDVSACLQTTFHAPSIATCSVQLLQLTQYI